MADTGFITERNLLETSESHKNNILKHLTATHSLEELKEYDAAPAEWVNIIFENVYKWGPNGDLIQSFFDNLVKLGEEDPTALKKMCDTALQNLRKNKKKTLTAIDHTFDSVNEYYLFGFMRNRYKNRIQKLGNRHDWMSTNITSKLVQRWISKTVLDSLFGSEGKTLITFVILALSCYDRVGAPGSHFTRKNYETLTDAWSSLIVLPEPEVKKTFSISRWF